MSKLKCRPYWPHWDAMVGLLIEQCINKCPGTSMNASSVLKENWAKTYPKWCVRLLNSSKKCLYQFIVAPGGSTCYWIIGCTYFFPSWFPNLGLSLGKMIKNRNLLWFSFFFFVTQNYFFVVGGWGPTNCYLGADILNIELNVLSFPCDRSYMQVITFIYPISSAVSFFHSR